jgi:outer membrane protein, heavy metal efflux system
MNLASPIRYLLSVLLVYFCSALPAQAQTPEQDRAAAVSAAQYVSATQGTTLDELIKLTLDRNKELVAARAQLRQGEGRLVQARLRPNPTLDVQYGTDAPFANEGEYNYSLAFSQPVELGGKRGKRMRVARLFIEVTKAQIADTARQLTGQMRALFGEAMAAAARLDLLEQVSELNERMVQVMETRLRAGDASRLDSSLLLAETNRWTAQRIQAEAQLAGALLQIKTLAGLAPEEPLTLRGRGSLPVLDLTQEAALQLAMLNRPDLHAARLREEMAEATVDLVKAQAVPNISVFALYSQGIDIIEGLFAPAASVVDPARILGFGVTIPLPFSNRSQGDIAEAVALRAQARAQREGSEQMIRRDVLLAHRRYEAARRALDVLNRGVVAESRESFRIVKLAYDLGEMRLLDVVTQQRLFMEAQMSYASAQQDYYAALVELGRAIGKEIPTRTP